MKWRGEIKPKDAKTCLIASIILFITGGFMDCACPGIHVLAAILAGAAIWGGSRGVRIWGVVLVIASFLMAGSETQELLIQAKARRAKLLRRLHESQLTTNKLEQGAKNSQSR